jgi:acyl carrier protein
VSTPLNQPDVARRTEQWVRSHFAISPNDPRFGRSADLFEGGYVDSVGLAELLGFIEEEFAVEVPDDELVSDGFATIDGIAQVVVRLATTTTRRPSS